MQLLVSAKWHSVIKWALPFAQNLDKETLFAAKQGNIVLELQQVQNLKMRQSLVQ